MKYKIQDIGCVVVKQDEKYTVKDNHTLKNLIVSHRKRFSGKKINDKEKK